MYNPLDQFISTPLLFNFKIALTSLDLGVVLVALLMTFIFFVYVLGTNAAAVWDEVLEPFFVSILPTNPYKQSRYQVVYGIVFLMVVAFNLGGMVFWTMTVTSYSAVTFFFSVFLFVGINIIGLANYKWRMLNLFLPSGAPIILGPFLFVIEVLSYFARVLSLGIRLFANLMAGHALMKILATVCAFVWENHKNNAIKVSKEFSLYLNGENKFWWQWVSIWIMPIFSIFIPTIFVFAITFLEMAIALLQAYVLITLASLYLNDVKAMH
jgi:ATP synthase subunit 6